MAERKRDLAESIANICGFYAIVDDKVSRYKQRMRERRKEKEPRKKEEKNSNIQTRKIGKNTVVRVHTVYNPSKAD